MLQVIMFVFREFILLGGENKCHSVVLWYYDGDAGGKSSFCGTKLPNVTRSSSNIAIFELHSSGQYSWSGFRIEYAAVHRFSDSRYPVIGAGNVVANMCIRHMNIHTSPQTSYQMWYLKQVDSLPHGKKCRHFADDSFKGIFMNYFFYFDSNFANVYTQSPINNKTTLVQEMALCGIGDQPFPEPMLAQFTAPYVRHWGEMS